MYRKSPKIASLGENIPLGGLSCLMWLCHDKLSNVMNEIQVQSEQATTAKKAITTAY
jgi:hypothetical protein